MLISTDQASNQKSWRLYTYLSHNWNSLGKQKSVFLNIGLNLPHLTEKKTNSYIPTLGIEGGTLVEVLYLYYVSKYQKPKNSDIPFQVCLYRKGQ